MRTYGCWAVIRSRDKSHDITVIVLWLEYEDTATGLRLSE